MCYTLVQWHGREGKEGRDEDERGSENRTSETGVDTALVPQKEHDTGLPGIMHVDYTRGLGG